MAVTTTVAVDGTPTEATPAVAPDGSWVVRAGALSEGGHTLKVTATDTAGNAATVSRAVLVDSTEQLGDRPVGPGAVGADVAELIDFLRDEKAYTGPAGRRYTVRVARAVRALQRKNQIEPTGVADRDTLSLLVGRIEVDLSEFRLSLVRGKRVIKSYSIATGSWDHPTPTGSYEIITKEVDPTWNPPDSPWAEGLGPIPPGPGNPLGTRWIGTSAPAIGIHGTYADYSIGTPASHGCMRMHISDVEDLYERVEVGMPVEIHE
jgi:lipoprotein-anchoring transpeptidase ErfK/SrfK